MNRKPVPAKAVLLLVAAVVVLPVAISIVLGLGSLLAVMGDDVGGAVLRYVALACAILWVLGLVCLLVAQSLNWLVDQPPDNDQTDR